MAQKNNKNESGQALVELAILTPILLFALAAVIGLSLAAQHKALIARAALASARVAVVRPDLAAQEAQNVIMFADSNIKRSDINVSLEPIYTVSLLTSNLTRLTVTLNYKPITAFGWHPAFKIQSQVLFDGF